MTETREAPPVQLAELGGWPAVLGRLIRGEDLEPFEASAALTDIFEGTATPAQVSAFLTLIHAKGETVDELRSLVETMLRFAEPVPIAHDIVDTCGTGGSQQRREACFNVSTLVALTIAGAGAKVAKHGGRSATATSSSGDFLTALGVAIELGPEGVARCVDEVGMGFCFAPRFHPAMRHAAAVRREIGVPTVFNFVAPLSNPARPRRQVLGVSDSSLAEKMVEVLRANGATRAMVVYGHDGLDELTITTTSTAIELRDGAVVTREIDPTALGLALATADEVRGGTAADNAELAKRVLGGEAGAHRDVVVLNAAAGLVVAGLADDLEAGIEQAQASLDGGQAGGVLEGLVRVSNSVAASN